MVNIEGFISCYSYSVTIDNISQHCNTTLPCRLSCLCSNGLYQGNDDTMTMVLATKETKKQQSYSLKIYHTLKRSDVKEQKRIILQVKRRISICLAFSLTLQLSIQLPLFDSDLFSSTLQSFRPSKEALAFIIVSSSCDQHTAGETSLVK